VTVASAQAFSGLPATLRDDLLSAFNEIVKNYRELRWEPAELNGGKLCEAVFTIVEGWLRDGNYPARAKKPSRFPQACLDLEQTYQHVPNSRSPRILIPRMMLGLYDIRNNRGVGHADGDVNPNHMDATAVLYTSKWLMAELVRLLHALSTAEAASVVDGLIEREVTLVWSSGATKRVLKPGMTYKEQTLLLLLTEPGEVAESELARWIEHPALSTYRNRILRPLHDQRFIEYNELTRSARLLPPGVTAAESIVATTV
jgi:hypothetical protein